MLNGLTHHTYAQVIAHDCAEEFECVDQVYILPDDTVTSLYCHRYSAYARSEIENNESGRRLEVHVKIVFRLKEMQFTLEKFMNILD